jgi:hypothetical protein
VSEKENLYACNAKAGHVSHKSPTKGAVIDRGAACISLSNICETHSAIQQKCKDA